MSSTRSQFAGAVLTALGVAETGPNTDALVAVMTEENTGAEWNPCATTMAEPEAGTEWPPGEPWNSITLPGGEVIHVWSYPTEAEGVAATADTLRLPPYVPVLRLLAQGVDADAVVRAWASGPWGTWSGDPDAATVTLLTVQANRADYYGREVPGPDPAPPAPLPVPDNPEVNVNVPQLSLGSQGPAVKAAQSIANEKFGASPQLVVDGDYGPKTEAVVQAIQRSRTIADDGVLGPITWDVFVNKE